MSEITLETVELSADWRAIVVGGDVDLASVDELDKAIKEILAAEKSNLAVDLTATNFMDSTGLRCLVTANRSFQDLNLEFALAVKPGPIERLLDLSGIDSLIKVVPNLSQFGSEH